MSSGLCNRVKGGVIHQDQEKEQVFRGNKEFSLGHVVLGVMQEELLNLVGRWRFGGKIWAEDTVWEQPLSAI